MKLRNKKTGKIVDVESLGHADSLKGKFGYQVTLSWKIDEHLDTCKTYNSLAELNEEWEDYEEQKEYWYIGIDGEIYKKEQEYFNEAQDSIGNRFETKEEAEKAVEKLKAWKRLKDKGFKVDLWDYDGGNYQERIRTGRILFRVKDCEEKENDKDLDLLFGGEE